MKFKMQPFFQWFEKYEGKKPWLVIGKGPSFDNLDKVNLDRYSVIALNHVMFKVPCVLGHAIDLDVHEFPADGFMCEFLVCPWEPHIKFVPGKQSLIDLMMDNKLGFNNILYYNSSRTNDPKLKSQGPIVKVRHFGSVAVMNLLAMAGVKEVFTLGVDGGSSYGKAFDRRNLLANGRKSFNAQFDEFKETSNKYGMKITPLF